MKENRSVLAGIAALLGTVVILSLLIPSLHAAHSSAAGAAPPWEPDPNSAAPYGNLVFYDSSGNVVTGGTDLSHLFDYVAATTAGDSGANKATLYFAAPNHASVTGAWAVNQQSSSNTFPNNSAPAPLTGPGFTKPVDTLGATDANLTAALGSFTLDSTAGYADIIQVRMKDSGPLGVSSGSNYWSTDIAYNTGTSTTTVDGVSVAAGGWGQIYPAPVPKAATTTSVAVSSGTVTAGTPVTYTATVTPTPDGGTVAFNDGSGNPATTGCAAQTVSTTTGTATCTVTYRSNGTYTTKAQFSGTPTFAGSTTSTPATVAVSGGSTATTITLAPTTAGTTGKPVTYTATITPAPDGGTVAFTDGSGIAATTGCATQPVSSGTSTCTVTYTTAGSYTVNATYSGDPKFGGSTTSSPQTQTITQSGGAPTSTTVTSSTSPSVVGQKVTYTATVASTPPVTGTPAGTVTFNDGSTPICTAVTLSSGGTATCQQTPTTAAAHPITAAYANTDGKFAASTSPPFSQVVNKSPTGIALTSSLNPAPTATMVTFTATITPQTPGSGLPTGTVTFSDGTGKPASSCTAKVLTSGAATCPVSYTATGTDQVSATYSGDTNFAGSSTSSALAETVQATGSSAAAAPASLKATPGDGRVVLSWSAPTAPGGTVTGYDVFDGTAPGQESTTPVNTSPITATSYTATGLTDGTPYYFTVKAITAAGTSPASTEVSATPASAAIPTGSTGSTATGSTAAGSNTGSTTAPEPSAPASPASASSQSGSLPFTGFKTTAVVASALLLVGLGICLVGLSRNRKKFAADR